MANEETGAGGSVTQLSPQPGAASAKSASKILLLIGVVITVVVVLVLALVMMEDTPSTLEEEEGNTDTSSLVGQWNIDSYSELDEIIPYAGGYIEFRADGTGILNLTFQNGGKILNFDWTQTSNRVVISGVTGTYTIDGDSLTMSCNFWDLTGTKA